jgi:hypothetical protein
VAQHLLTREESDALNVKKVSSFKRVLNELFEPLIGLMWAFSKTKIIHVVLNFLSFQEATLMQAVSSHFYHHIVPHVLKYVPCGKTDADIMLSKEPEGLSDKALETWRRLGPMKLHTFYKNEQPYAKVEYI